MITSYHSAGTFRSVAAPQTVAKRGTSLLKDGHAATCFCVTLPTLKLQSSA